MRNQSNNFLLDGTSNNDTFNTGFVLRPPPDAIQEFKILTHSYSAEYGRNSGSVVNVVTTAGSNAAARRGLGIQPRRRAAGAELLCAGEPAETEAEAEPVRRRASADRSQRERMFGFGYYEGHRNTSGNTQNIVVLTDAQRNGQFRNDDDSRSADRRAVPGQHHSRRIGSAQRHGGCIDEFVPRANSAGQPLHRVARRDRRPRPDGRPGRLPADRRSNSHAGALSAQPDRSDRRRLRPGRSARVAKATLQDFMASDTHIFSRSMINVARFSYNRIGANPAVTSGLSNSDYGINVPQNVPIGCRARQHRGHRLLQHR